MVFKCINNLAPKYLSSLIRLRLPSKYSVRLNNDYYLLEVITSTNFKQTEGAFSFIAPRIWNDLPYSLRCLSELSLFKKSLKTHYFRIAFSDEALDGS